MLLERIRMNVLAPARPIDLEHLSRYTGGDGALNCEVLTLFVGQAEQLIARLRIHLERCDDKSWRETNHALKGGARGVGAFALADTAAACEPLNLVTQSAEAGRLVEQLRSQSHAVKLFVEAYLGS